MPDAPKVFKKTKVESKRLRDISGSYDKERHIDYNSRRPDHHKFYWGMQWKNFRAWLKQNPDYQLCKICKENGLIQEAEILDHIIPITEAWNLRLEPKNIRALCRSCHSKYGAKKNSKRVSGKSKTTVLC